MKYADWREVFERYHSSEATLENPSIVGELAVLKRELAANVFVFPPRRDWVIDRIKELERVLGKEQK